MDESDTSIRVLKARSGIPHVFLLNTEELVDIAVEAQIRSFYLSELISCGRRFTLDRWHTDLDDVFGKLF